MKNQDRPGLRTFTLDAVRPAQGGLSVQSGIKAGDTAVAKAKTADKAYQQMDAYIKQ